MAIQKINKASGIYKIVNLINSRFYIGSTVNIYHRWNVHKHHLINNTHSNKHLQHAWNKYGANSFNFIVVTYCDRHQLLLKEQQMLDMWYNTGNCYNICPTAGNSLGRICSMETREKISKTSLNRIVSLETREKLSRIHAGRKCSEKTKKILSMQRVGISKSSLSVEKMRNSKSGIGIKLTSDDVKNIYIRRLNGEKVKSLATEYSVGTTIISNIALGKKWKTITEKINGNSENK